MTPHSERQPAAPWPVAVGDLAAPSIPAMGLLAVFCGLFSAVTDLAPVQTATLAPIADSRLSCRYLYYCYMLGLCAACETLLKMAACNTLTCCSTDLALSQAATPAATQAIELCGFDLCNGAVVSHMHMLCRSTLQWLSSHHWIQTSCQASDTAVRPHP